MTVTVLGAGSWGTALSVLLARNGQKVTLYGRGTGDVQSMREHRRNARYLPEAVLDDSITVTDQPGDLSDSDLWVIATPSHAVHEAARLVTGASPQVVVASKGLEERTARTLADVALDLLPQADVGAFSGPNLAVEIERGIPTAAVAAFSTLEAADRVREAFACRSFRIYLSQDIRGVELAGALKNVLAIGAGMGDGLGFGDNTKGALLARGLHQMTSLGLAMGAKIETFLGVAGVGDLFATAASRLSRNYRVGFAVGSGKSLPEALAEIGQVAEGVPTSGCAIQLAQRHSVSMSVFEGIHAVLHGEMEPLEAVTFLMDRIPRTEGLLADRTH